MGKRWDGRMHQSLGPGETRERAALPATRDVPSPAAFPARPTRRGVLGRGRAIPNESERAQVVQRSWRPFARQALAPCRGAPSIREPMGRWCVYHCQVAIQFTAVPLCHHDAEEPVHRRALSCTIPPALSRVTGQSY